MKAKVMARIHCVSTINVARKQEAAVTFSQQCGLVGSHMRTKQSFIIDIICIVSGSADVVLRSEQIVEALLSGDYWIELIKRCEERFAFIVLVYFIKM
jgi:hypothetical protein